MIVTAVFYKVIYIFKRSFVLALTGINSLTLSLLLKGITKSLMENFKERFENCGKIWTISEDNQLTKLFLKYNMEIFEIAEIHKRSEDEIKLRLVKLGHLANDFYLIDKVVEQLKNQIQHQIKAMNETFHEIETRMKTINDNSEYFNEEIEKLKNKQKD